ncbi:hypothetical protein DAERI_110128 [Deinococcus aerius]|uniref:Toxin-antitoxin system HicB family antitoxin n=1 Tax=Deinococcus aerius TaxID=200253 RepID=A0A2I9D820_9DEIO|nr:YlcI/YnfO family protein [Deinococcus aerius]GBF06946.1 hypothetical protein DAERI_110128 [Deinococcus aerius]
MSTLSVRLPDSLHKRLKDLAKQEGVSVNQLISTAVAEKVSALLTEDYLKERAARGSWEKFDAAMALVPDAEPDPADRLP